jgi:hypothetical protein
MKTMFFCFCEIELELHAQIENRKGFEKLAQALLVTKS